MNDSDHVVAMETWYLGAQNDGIFIINRPPRPSNDHPIHERADGPTLVLPLGNMPEKQARAIIDAHNSELLASRLAKQAPATHRHKKRGSEYVLIGIGKMQAELWFDGLDENMETTIDMREVAIYRSVDDGSLWVRPLEEFNDGRFEALPSPVGGSVS